MNTVAVVGLGYVGLPTAIALVERGIRVIGYDISEARLADIKSSNVDLLERDHQRLQTHRDSIWLTTEPSALSEADAIIVCVPTPVDKHLSPDLRALRGACDDVVQYAISGQTIILTSTTYVGCTQELIVAPLEVRGLMAGENIFIAFSPERIDPGVANHVQEDTPRVVGGVTAECTAKATAVLSQISSVIHSVSSPEAAEMTKLVENTYRAVNIALANEFADMADELRVDVMEVIDAAATKPYGFQPFYPGPGVGGHCIPCDPHYLLWQLRAKRHDAPVTRTAMTAIAARPRTVVDQAREALSEIGIPPHQARVLVLGVAYKPNVADVRESPALEIIDGLTEAGVQVFYSDPLVNFLDTPNGRIFHTAHDGDDWDLVLIHTRHQDIDEEWLAAQSTVLDTTYRVGR